MKSLAQKVGERLQGRAREARHRRILHRRLGGAGGHVGGRVLGLVRARLRHLLERGQARAARCSGRHAARARRGERGDRARDGARRAAAAARGTRRARRHRRRRPRRRHAGQAGRHGVLRLGERALGIAARRASFTGDRGKRAARSRLSDALRRGFAATSREDNRRHECGTAGRRGRHVLSRRRARSSLPRSTSCSDGVEQFEPRLGYPKALIVPHAGYIYSGRVAARAYDELAAARGMRDARGAARSRASRGGARASRCRAREAFATPLGQRAHRPRRASPASRDLPQVVASDAGARAGAFAGSAAAVPAEDAGRFRAGAVRGRHAPASQEVAEVLERLWGGPETLIVISHRHVALPRVRARRGASTARRSSASRGFATDLDHEEACGATPLNGLLACCQAEKALADPASSRPATPATPRAARTRVVGYSSFALYEGGEVVA